MIAIAVGACLCLLVGVCVSKREWDKRKESRRESKEEEIREDAEEAGRNAARLAELEKEEAGRKKAAEARREAEKEAAVRAELKALAETRAAGEAAALGLLQPLEALTLEPDTLHRVTAAAVAYCDAQGVASFADLVGRASRLIAHPQAVLVLSCF